MKGGGDARAGGAGVSGTEALIAAIAALSRARSTAEISRVVRRAGHRLARADGSAVALLEGSACHFVEEEGVAPGWKGRRIPLAASLCGLSMSERRTEVVADVKADIRLQVAPYWSTPVASVAVVPVRASDPLGALALYWSAVHTPTGDELRLLQALAESASLAMENVAARVCLEARVRERTAELEESNRRLQLEISERRRAEDEVRQMSLVDELTGLYNRRGFMVLAGRELKALQRGGRRAMVLFVDIDGLKRANDNMGHEAGDRLLARAAAALRSVCRDTDVAARIGGDEFAVFMALGYDHPPVHLIVERYLDAGRRAGISWSIGATATPPGRQVTLDDLVAGADEAMYRGRRARRQPRMATGA